MSLQRALWGRLRDKCLVEHLFWQSETSARIIESCVSTTTQHDRIRGQGLTPAELATHPTKGHKRKRTLFMNGGTFWGAGQYEAGGDANAG